MRLFDKVRQQKVLSFGLVLCTLSIGIVIGTLVNPRVHAAKSQAVAAPDATPLVIPNPVLLGNEFTKLAKKLEPSVVYITADYTPKTAETRHESAGARRRMRMRTGPSRRRGPRPVQEVLQGGLSAADTSPRAFRQEQSGHRLHCR